MGPSVRRSRLTPLLAVIAWIAPACDGSKSNTNASQPVESGTFGGSAGVPGVAEAVPVASTGGAGGGAGAVPGECQNTPVGKVALIDDFNDGDSVAAFEPNREAYWFTVHDESAGTIDPPGAFMPVVDGYRGTPSAHVSARDFTTWGAELAANISHKDAIRCPYDASAFAGLTFVARGSGRVRVQLAMPGVVSKEYGGTCDPGAGQVCYDDHGSFVVLGPDWRVYELPWSSFVQRGYGVPVQFDPKTIHSLHFSMETRDLPAELWLDDVAFWDGRASSSGGGAGTGGAEGGSAAAGEGGGSAAGEAGQSFHLGGAGGAG